MIYNVWVLQGQIRIESKIQALLEGPIDRGG